MTGLCRILDAMRRQSANIYCVIAASTFFDNIELEGIRKKHRPYTRNNNENENILRAQAPAGHTSTAATAASTELMMAQRPAYTQHQRSDNTSTIFLIYIYICMDKNIESFFI